MSGEHGQAKRGSRLSEAELYRIAFEGSTDAIVIFDGNDGLILEANPAASELYGHDLAAFRRLTVDDLCGTVAPPQQDSTDDEPAGVVPLFERHRRKDGSEFPVDVSVGTAVAGSKPVSVMVVRDVSERRRMEQELRAQRLQEELHSTHRLASLGRLAAGVAHEINNPLTYIIGHADLVRDQLSAATENVTENTAPLLDTISDGVRRIQAIVKDLTAFSRGDESQRSVMRIEPLIDSMVRLVENELRDRATLEREYGETKAIVANPGELGQVIVNLLTNAAQAIEPGDEANHRVTVRTSMPDGNHVLLEVNDTGCGIPHERLHSIFDPFFTSQSMAVKSGMGLAVCQGIVTGLGGELSVESSEGTGSTFRVLLPATDLPTG